MYKNAPEEHHFYRFFISIQVNVPWSNSGLESFAVDTFFYAEVGTGVKARRFSM